MKQVKLTNNHIITDVLSIIDSAGIKRVYDIKKIFLIVSLQKLYIMTDSGFLEISEGYSGYTSYGAISFLKINIGMQDLAAILSGMFPIEDGNGNVLTSWKLRGDVILTITDD